MNNYFKEIMNTYWEDNDKKVDKNKPYYNVLMNQVPNYIDALLDNQYYVKGSCGIATKTYYPWVGIFNKQLAHGAKKGIYIAYLFRRDMRGVYVCLTQGYTYFKDTYKKHREVIEKATDDFQSFFTDEPVFTKNQIDLNSKRNDLGDGYEQTTILSKYYNFATIEQEDMEQDLIELIHRYKELIGNMNAVDYELAIDAKAYGERHFHQSVETSEATLESVFAQYVDTDGDIPLTTLEEVSPPKGKGKTYTTKKHTIQPKIDYIQKAKNDQLIGLKGEELVLYYEKNRLDELGRTDLANKISWVSQDSDSYGYDIESFDIDDEGKEYPIKIEVKTTTAEDGPFYLSHNELVTSKKYGNNYRLYRVYDIKESPKVYKLVGDLEKRVTLEPLTFKAKIK